MAKRTKKDEKKEPKVKAKKESPFVEIESKITMNVVLVHDIYCKANGKCECRRVKHYSTQVEHVPVGKVKGVELRRGKPKVVVIPSSYTIVPGRQKVRKALLVLPSVRKAIDEGFIKVLK